MADKYPDGTDIVRFPKMVYPEGKPTRANSKDPVEHKLVNSLEELKDLVASDQRYACYLPSKEKKQQAANSPAPNPGTGWN